MAEALAIQSKVLEYENFVNDVLRKDLLRVQQQEQKALAELANYLQVQTFARQLKEQAFGDCNQLKLKSDLGANFYVNCVV